MLTTMTSLHWCIHVAAVAALAVVLCRQYQQNYSDRLRANSSTGAESRMNSVHSSHCNASSVWCWGDHHTNRLCHFDNLYYLPSEDEFVFVHGPCSVYLGLPPDRFEPALLDMSSVANHNAQFFNFLDVDVTKLPFDPDSVTFVDRTSLIFRRFNSDNLMHVLHDDLLPMFVTLLSLPNVRRNGNEEPFDVQLVFWEGWDPGQFRDLYAVFSTVEPMFKQDLQRTSKPICFRKAYVGILKHSTWYQYGFFVPQGPIPSHNVTASVIRHFCNYLRTNMGINLSVTDDNQIAVLVSRKINRLILNEVDLTVALAQTLHMKVVNVGFETHSVMDMITIVSRASFLIGMHGSLLALAMFLPQGATLVELFPYGVNPLHYTPFRTLTNIPGMDLRYISWQNMDASRTVGHPNRSWEEGGIAHLPNEEQDQILSSTEVPLHLCCRDAAWLYHIYQDTIVDVAGVIALISNSKSINSPVFGYKNLKRLFHQNSFPSFVRNITCTGSKPFHGLPSLTISWQPPANIKYLEHNDVKYELWIQEMGKDDYTAWILTKYEHTFTAGIQPATNYNIWIRCIMDTVNGPFNVHQVSCNSSL